MPVDEKNITQKSRERLNNEYQMSISDDGLKKQGISERYAVIYQEEYNKALKQQATSQTPQPQSKPIAEVCCYNPAQASAKNNPDTKCNFNTVTVEKAGRKYTLNVDKNTASGDNIIEIVAGPNKNAKDVTVTVGGLIGPCTTGHKNKVLDLVNPKPINKTDTELKFKAASISYIPFVSSLWPSNAPVNTYNIPISTCNLKRSVVIKVYPDIEYNFTIKVNPGLNKSSFGFHNGVKMLEKQDKEFISIEGNIKQDNTEYSLEKTFDFENITKAIKTADTILNTIKKMSSTFNSNVEIEYKFLNLKLDLKSKWVEIEGSPKCGYECTFDLGMAPLFGIGVKIDALGAAIESIPGVGKVLDKIKKYIEKSDLLKIKLTLELSGEINCELLGIKKVTDQDIKLSYHNTNGQLTAGIKAELTLMEGQKHYGDTFGLEAGANAGGEAKVTLGIKDSENKAKAEFYYGFNGLEIFYAVYGKASAFNFEYEKKSEGKTTVFDPIEDRTITIIDLKNK